MDINQEHKSVIGTLDTNGNAKKWPALDINGGRYNQPATMQPISAEYFVVLPAGFRDWEAVKTLKQQYGGVMSAVAFADSRPLYTPDELVSEVVGDEFSSKRGKR